MLIKDSGKNEVRLYHNPLWCEVRSGNMEVIME